MQDAHPVRRALWLASFAVAMGILESAVVVYLRELYYPSGFSFPIVPMAARIALVEIVREIMTILMLFAVSAIARRDGLDGFYVFGLLFGVWDLTYYAGLEVFLGWPPSIGTWDILFLVPVPWVAPVAYPMLVSVLLIAGFAANEVLVCKGRALRLSLAEWGVASGGAALVVVSFCWRFRAALDGTIPRAFPGLLFALGIALAVGPFAIAGTAALRRT